MVSAATRTQIHDPEWLESPFLTLGVQLATAIGGFIALWTIPFLIANLHHGFATWWWMALVLAVDVALNVGLRVQRARRVRARERELTAAGRPPGRSP
jgi:predicted lysophospholipase L1 biosynthesis ABC-type transport system permease subunit